MDFTNILRMIPLYIKYGGQVRQIWNEAQSNEEFFAKLQATLPAVAELAGDIAGDFWPDLAPQVRAIASAALGFNTQLVKWVQEVCNTVLELDPPLDVDGMYGPKTKAAVRALQQHLGVTADGWFGKLTEAAVAKLKLALPKPA